MKPTPDTDTLSAPNPMPNLAWLRDPIVSVRIHGTRREVDLRADRARFVVGSHGEADVFVDDAWVSRHHCTFERDGDSLIVRDRGSKNGTFLNGNRIAMAEASPGALVTIGKTTLVFVSRRGRGRHTALEQMRGNDPVFREAIDTAVRAASSSFSVLILGETGTGKELIARAIHESSPRSALPFVALNCGAIPAQLIGSELFGHVAGAFTGAVGDRDGVFVRADGGTLFLDELGELPLEQQPHLLRVLETRTVRPVGGQTEHAVDVRLVAATNRLHHGRNQASGMRLDLYHRIATVVIHLPPLRERRADIPLLVRGFLRELAGESHPFSVSRGTMNALARYDWPGNVRELRRACERAVALGQGELMLADFLPPAGLTRILLPDREPPAPAEPAPPAPRDRPESPMKPVSPRLRSRRRKGLATLLPGAPELAPIDQHARDIMMDALDRHGSIRKAAEALGMAKSTFADRCKKYGIKTSWP